MCFNLTKTPKPSFEGNSIPIQLRYFIINCLPLKLSNTHAIFDTMPGIYWLGKEQGLTQFRANGFLYSLDSIWQSPSNKSFSSIFLSQHTQLRRTYDMILVDTSPV